MTIQDDILKFAERQKTFKAADVLAGLDRQVSRPYVSKALTTLVRQGRLVREGTRRGTTYALPQHREHLGQRIRRTYEIKGLEEHRVLSELESVAPFMRELPENVKSIFDYAFLEMLNNAIDHSGSKRVEITLAKSGKDLRFTVADHGIGVFRNVMDQRRLRSPIAAMQDLMKGKTTTQPQAHSGEGIFFTSKVGDTFALDSYGYRLSTDNTLPDVFFERIGHTFAGTKVTFAIGARSRRHLNDAFKEFQSDPGSHDFDKTDIKVRLYQHGTIHISRSQARRILTGLDRFKVVVLDFERVPVIGQAFADEVFRVFKRRHPDMEIRPVNMNEAVTFMVERAQRTKR